MRVRLRSGLWGRSAWGAAIAWGCGAMLASGAVQAEPHATSPSPALGIGRLQAMDEAALASVHGAGLDVGTLLNLGAHTGRQAKDTDSRSSAAVRRGNELNTALAAAVELQGRMAPRIAASSVAAVTGAALATSGLLVTTPVSLIALNLPFVGMLPALPRKQDQ